MATSPINSEAVVQVDLEATVRRSSRNVLTPTRFQYSPEIATAINKKRTTTTTTTTTHNDKKRQNSRKDIKEEDVENSAVECTSGGHAGLSSYELERLENIRQNQAFLSSINLFQATEELKQVTRPKLSKRRLIRSEKGVPVRKSLRLQSLTLPPKPGETQMYRSPHKKPPGPLLMKPVNMEDDAKLPSQLLELFSEDSTEDRKMELDLKEYRSALKNMKKTENRVAKVLKKRLVTAAFHPCTSSLLMATGNTLGNVALWKLDSDWGNDGVLCFEPHALAVACIAFSRAHPTQLLSLSHDGSLRCMDVQKAVFDDVYDSEEQLKTFDFMSHDCTSLVVGYFNGKVAIVDRRTPGNSHESIHSLKSKHSLLCVSVHPLQKQYFAVAENEIVNIYDSRYLKKSKTVSRLHGHSLSIHSAYFSPHTGNRVLTSCMDGYIRIYDTSAVTKKAPLLTSIRHKMQTASYKIKVSAVWDPKREDCFVVGSTSKPHSVKVFHESGKPLHSFVERDNVTSELYVTAFHPTRNALLGGTGSGQLHVFSD